MDVDRYADVRRDRLERPARRATVRADGSVVNRYPVAARRSPSFASGPRASFAPAGNPAHQRGPLREANRQRRDQLLALRVHEHDLDVVLEQYLPQAQALVHPRSAERHGRQLDAGQPLGAGR